MAHWALPHYQNSRSARTTSAQHHHEGAYSAILRMLKDWSADGCPYVVIHVANVTATAKAKYELNVKLLWQSTTTLQGFMPYRQKLIDAGFDVSDDRQFASAYKTVTPVIQPWSERIIAIPLATSKLLQDTMNWTVQRPRGGPPGGGGGGGGGALDEVSDSDTGGSVAEPVSEETIAVLRRLPADDVSALTELEGRFDDDAAESQKFGSMVNSTANAGVTSRVIPSTTRRSSVGPGASTMTPVPLPAPLGDAATPAAGPSPIGARTDEESPLGLSGFG